MFKFCFSDEKAALQSVKGIFTDHLCQLIKESNY